MDQAGLSARIDLLLCALLDAQSRQRIMSAWRIGQIDGDEACELLTDLGLVEMPNG